MRKEVPLQFLLAVVLHPVGQVWVCSVCVGELLLRASYARSSLVTVDIGTAVLYQK